MQSPSIRIVTWNIEKGKRWSLLEKSLDDESIRSADILCLNEVDEGMARSGNRSIAGEIAARLGMQAVFGRTFREFTKGIGEELQAPGKNTTAIQGNATLSRLPVLATANLLLPACADHSRRAERREGNRHVLVVTLQSPDGPAITVANAHLEVYGTARCRGRQMRFILDHVPPGPAIVTGDFNTNTFDRGSALHTFRSVGRLLSKSLSERTLNPERHEPLFDELRRAGFSWQPFNDRAPTCSVDLSGLEDQRVVPRFIRDYVLSRHHVVPLRLDFICGREIQAASPGRTLSDPSWQASDHLPITCDFTVAPAPPAQPGAHP